MRFVIMCAAILFIVSPVFADMIYFKNGNAISGKVLRVTETDVEFSTSEFSSTWFGPDNVSRSNVQKIVYSDGETVDFETITDMIYFTDGKAVSGIVLRITETNIEYSYGNVPLVKQNRNKLQKIVYKNGKTIVFNENNTVPQNVTNIQTTEITPVETPKAKGAEEHDGFYFGFLYGMGFGKSRISGSNKLDVYGFSIMENYDIGYAVVDNFILFTGMGILCTFKSKKYSNENSYSNQSPDDLAIVGGWRFGFRSYLMPENIFVSAAVAYSKTSFGNDSTSVDAKAGLDYSLAIGKEWWVSDNWGLGVALYGEYGSTSCSDKNYKGNVSNYAIGLAFTATYN